VIGRIRWRDRVLSRVAQLALSVLASTWRVRTIGFEHLASLRAAKRPFVAVLWHGRLLPILYRHRGEGVTVLISRHRDGEVVARAAERWGYRTVRGSSTRGGHVGLLGLVDVLRAGGEVAVTPDGPRGPAEIIKPGAVVAAKLGGAAVIAIGARASRAWRLSSWDGMLIPRPFARVDIQYSVPLAVSADERDQERELAAVADALQQVTHDA
jgi:lysophospholipid acyltransferase (LPLAT)-like uncharacterized protein